MEFAFSVTIFDFLNELRLLDASDTIKISFLANLVAITTN